MQQQHGIVWVPRSVQAEMIAEATKRYPLETGGVLAGYFDQYGTQVVVVAAVGPGPNALHFRESFVPDADYHEEQIAALYERSGRLHTYIGDWHTHPDAAAYLSARDAQALKRIAEYRDARVSTPIMAILAGAADAWTLKIWQHARVPKLAIWRKPIRVMNVRFH